MPLRCDDRPYDARVNDWWTASNWWFGAVGVVVGVAGLVFGIIAWLRPRKSQLQILIKQREIGIPNDPDLGVIFRGKRLERPTLVEISIEHVGGPEIPERDMPAGGITFTSDRPAVVGALGETAAIASLDNETSRIMVKPYLNREGTIRRLTYLAEGQAKYSVHLAIANATTYRASWVRRHPQRMELIMSGVLVGAVVVAALSGGAGWGSIVGYAGAAAYVGWLVSAATINVASHVSRGGARKRGGLVGSTDA